MFPVVATGALNPEPGLTAAVIAVGSSSLPSFQTGSAGFVPTSDIVVGAGHADGVPSGATGIAPNYGADKLAAQVMEALARCRRLGHRQPSVTLTRPGIVVAGVEQRLRDAGLAVEVAPSRVPGISVLTVRG
ncbi:MAG: hypothetical protein RLY86_3010 [Pseudomonadota bacterium]|jgi:hypothetical protein